MNRAQRADVGAPTRHLPQRTGSGRDMTDSKLANLVGGGRRWFWGVDFFHRQGRAEPHQGQVDTLDEAKAAWRKCWDSADVPTTGRSATLN
jgi:hypothetical protein